MFPRDDNDNYIAPDVIYLQVQESEVSWCADKINDTDVEYVKHTELAECQQERDRLAEAADKERDKWLTILQPILTPHQRNQVEAALAALDGLTE